MEIKVSVCNDSLNAVFEIPEDVKIPLNEILNELLEGDYNRPCIDPFKDDIVKVTVNTRRQFTTFVQWLALRIPKN